MRYQVKQGDSPARIARRYGVPMNALIRANAHKPTRDVAGVRTWQSLRSGEAVRVPVGVGEGFLGAITPAPLNAPHKQISITNPGPHVADADVALWQSIIGVTADGLFGPNTQAATKAWQSAHGLTADGIVGPNTWGAAMLVAAPAAAAATIPQILQQLPSILSPAPAPAPAPAPVPVSIPTVTPVNVPAAAQALASVDPCYSGNVAMVCAAQAMLGVTVDGKYGNDTATALRKFIPGAPAGCSPRPSWWTPTGQSNCTSGAALPPPLPSIPLPTPSAPLPIPSLPLPLPTPSSLPLPTPAATIPLPTIPTAPGPIPTVTLPGSAPGTQVVTAPAATDQKKLSTGTIVAGAVGAVALVGLVAVAMSGKSGGHSHGGGGPRRSGGRRKPTHKKKR